MPTDGRAQMLTSRTMIFLGGNRPDKRLRSASGKSEQTAMSSGGVRPEPLAGAVCALWSRNDPRGTPATPLSKKGFCRRTGPSVPGRCPPSRTCRLVHSRLGAGFVPLEEIIDPTCVLAVRPHEGLA